MLLRRFILSALFVSASTATPAQSQDSAEASPVPALSSEHAMLPGYRLVWSDEFSTNGLPDPARWNYDTHRNRQGWYNDELQYYAAGRLENSRIENGHLIIEAHAERLERRHFPDWGRQRYTSARLYTKGVQAWTYGFFEVRAKLPCAVGSWPAIWLLPEESPDPWPISGEIDIMEHVGHVPGEINQSVHTEAYNHIQNTHRTAKFMVPDACETMHRYQLLWTADFVLAGIDDQPKFMFRRSGNDRSRWPFDQPMHLLLNVAVGGSWGGQQGVDNAAFPARFEIDYVRVYQPDPATTAPATPAVGGR
ncbi:glycoside hydrolase family 16 protein [Sphingomonas lacunae]|uniref:Glycoside hydrolase family 16 protein n=2 Tax=Sphingomonas lacunae TaxID=2698828 RepID=A0A6M4AU45_9SPHN|nr:glycoside hydrolase family 16 protein [Sphingomonas lacunae]